MNASRRRRRTRTVRARWAALGVLLVVVLLAATAAVAARWLPVAGRLTNEPHPDDPAHVDALLVLYSEPRVYDEALRLIEDGVTDRVFVSAHLGPDGHEKLCGEPALQDPRLAGVSVECFDPTPVTTQGEMEYGARRMRELGLEHLGVLTFDQHLERSRILAERCWGPAEGRVSMYQFVPDLSEAERAQRTVYNTLALAKTAVTPECDGRLPAVVRWPLDLAKWLRGQPVGGAWTDSVPALGIAPCVRGMREGAA